MSSNNIIVRWWTACLGKQFTAIVLMSALNSCIWHPSPHKLALKLGAFVVLMISLNPKKGFCNGTRCIIKSITNHWSEHFNLERRYWFTWHSHSSDSNNMQRHHVCTFQMTTISDLLGILFDLQKGWRTITGYCWNAPHSKVSFPIVAISMLASHDVATQIMYMSTLIKVSLLICRNI